MKRKFFYLLLLNLLTFLSVNAQQTQFYVDPENGLDSNSGTSITKAFKTIDKAKKEVAGILSNGTLNGNIIIYLRGGVHTLNSTLEFSSSDSGTNNCLITYKNYKSESPIISSGEIINGKWKKDSGHIKKIKIGAGKVFRQLYINDICKTRARTPNLGSTKKFYSELQHDGFNIEKGLLDNLSDWVDKIELVASCKWMHKRLRISKTYNTDSYTRAVINATEWEALTKGPQGVRKYIREEYWIENAYEFLDKAGEWYYNDKSGWLYYWPLPHENLAKAEVIIPNIEKAFFLNGGDGIDFSKPITNLQFQGLTFKYCNYTRPNDFGFVDVQANTLIPQTNLDVYDAQYRHNQQKERIPAALSVHNGNNIVVKDCKFINLGGTGLAFNYGGENIFVSSNYFKDISGSAIEVGNDANKPNNDKMIPKNIVVYNNYIENIAKDYRGGVGILCFYIDGLIVKNNEIHNVPYTGISLGWGWGSSEADPVPEQNRNFTIINNKISGLATFTYDAGGIYTTNPVFGINIIEENYVKDLWLNYGAFYFDGYSSNWILNNNVIDNAPLWTAAQSFPGQVKGPIQATNNYTTTLAKLSEGWVNSSIEGTTLFSRGDEPSEVKEIINRCGLTSVPYIKNGPTK
ncbi:right-handed parallel beta-helix repeat-containing protein [uncultured Draconibacterium sp.]|uniref:right-handed parallel beta-helix repeat-containing protein n=1 Tax=uncultured Draconibacterium sp. TaxID=1573823 RepID=UPI0025DCDCD6|nr:right-handed parallel beta-helix repeat-containing protein [uncultured Draconibacterium sp.]